MEKEIKDRFEQLETCLIKLSLSLVRVSSSVAGLQNDFIVHKETSNDNIKHLNDLLESINFNLTEKIGEQNVFDHGILETIRRLNAKVNAFCAIYLADTGGELDDFNKRLQKLMIDILVVDQEIDNLIYTTRKSGKNSSK